MSAFHPITIGLLRAALNKSAVELESARRALAISQQLVEQNVAVVAERAAVVADGEQLLAYAESTNAAGDEHAFAVESGNADDPGYNEMPDQYYDPTATPLAVAFGAAPADFYADTDYGHEGSAL